MEAAHRHEPGDLVTTLSVNALSVDSSLAELLPPEERRHIRDWLLSQQYRREHPYTQAPAGGWAWTDLPGGVPDADDTAGALIALHNLGPHDDTVVDAARAGVTWLLDLQTVMAASRPFAAAGDRCLSTAAAPI